MMTSPTTTPTTAAAEKDGDHGPEPSMVALVRQSLSGHIIGVLILGSLATLVVVATHHTWAWWVLLPAVWSAAILVPVDIDHKLLPNIVTYPMAAAMLVTVSVLSLAYDTPAMLWRPVILTIAVSGLLFASSLAFGMVSGQLGMGLGDVKWSVSLVLALGALGINYVTTWLLVTAIAAAIGSIVAVVFSNAGRDTRLPYGPWMAVGLVAAIIFA